MIKPDLHVSPAVKRIMLNWGGPVLVGLAWVCMLLWSWMAWPDCIIDFGRELYVPWQLLEGRRLYTDIAYHNGPLSPYVNTLLFACFGVSLRTLVFANLAIATGALVVSYRLVKKISDRLTATLVGLTFATLFAFAHLTGIGNYNWITPYSHELSHGIVLSFLCLICLNELNTKRGHWRGLLGGICLGLVFLTKCEIFVAALAATAVQILLSGLTPGNAYAWRRTYKHAAMILSGSLMPIFLSFVLLSCIMPANEAFSGTIGAWAQVFKASNASSLFFQTSLGLDQPALRLAILLKTSAIYGILFGIALMLARRLPKNKSLSAPLLLFLVTAIIPFVMRKHIPWVHVATPFPLIMLLAAGLAAWPLWEQSSPRKTSNQDQLRLATIIFAGALLLKMALNTRIYHYGFALAMPAAMVVVLLLNSTIPGLIQNRGGNPRIFQAVFLGLWLATVGSHLAITKTCLAGKLYGVGQGADGFLADPRGTYLNAALDVLKKRSHPGQTLLALPDCEMLPYLARLPNPIPYGNFNPHQVQTYGEETMLKALQDNPPDFIAIVDADFAGYGYRYFGRDYAQVLNSWIYQHYQQAALIGAPPNQSKGFGIHLLQRR